MNLKNLQVFSNSLFSTLIIVVGMLVFNTVQTHSTCPPGYRGQYTVTIHKSATCRIEVDYCLSTGITICGFCDIHIGDIRYIGVGSICSTIIPKDQSGMYRVNWVEIINTIVRAPENFSCYPIAYIPECTEGTTRPAVRVTTGGCYYWSFGYNSDMEYFEKYEVCGMAGMTSCRTEYSFCRELVNGIWQIKTIEGDEMPQFTCDDPTCFSICGKSE